MLGPLARGTAPVRRRTRKRVVLAVLAALVVALLVGEVADQVVNDATPAARRASSSWIAAVVPVLSDSTSLASTLGELRALSGLPACTTAGCARPALDARLSLLVSGASADVAQLAELGLTAPSPRSGALATRVLADRSIAVTRLSGAVELLLGPSHSHTMLARAQGLLLETGAELSAADAAYRELVRSVPRGRGAPALGPSAWVADRALWTRSGVQSWAGRLAAAKTLVSTASVALLAVSTSPPVLRILGLPKATAPTSTTSTTTTSTTTTTTTTTTPRPGTPSTTTTSTTSTTTTTTVPPTTTTLQLPPAGSVSVLQPTTRLSVEAVVADAGSMDAPSVTVEVALLPIGRYRAGAPSLHARARIGGLRPGDARYMSLGPLAVRRGATYSLVVTATVPTWRPAVDRVTVRITA